MDTTFFYLLRVALGHPTDSLRKLTLDDWNMLWDTAQRQTLVGVLFAAIERLPIEQRPPRTMLIHWYAATERIKNTNRLLNSRAVEITNYFCNHGYECCILKGQGVALYYPNPLLRTSGDIDVWLSGNRRSVYDFANKKLGLRGLTYHHIHYPIFDDVDIEVHITPGYLYNPYLNHKLQNYFNNSICEQVRHRAILPDSIGEIAHPKVEFDLLYLLLHMYKHLIGQGIGLRQMMDYYYVLKQPITRDERERVVSRINEFKMTRFAEATMYIMSDVFGLEDQYLLFTPDSDSGQFLLDEIMKSGNFGKYDARIDRKNHHRLLPRVLNSMRRNWKFLVRYPHEIIWNIPFRLWQYGWSRLTSLKYK